MTAEGSRVHERFIAQFAREALFVCTFIVRIPFFHGREIDGTTVASVQETSIGTCANSTR